MIEIFTGPAARDRLWTRLNTALASAASADHPLPTPTVVVDLDAFDANAEDLARRAAGTPIRVASKSLRVPALISRALAAPGFAGVLGYTLAEALWLVEQGISDDVVVAYPTVDRGALERLVASPDAMRAITLMVDCAEHLDVIDAARVSTGSTSGGGSTPHDSAEAQVRVAIDVDAGLQVAGRHLGPKRSPLLAPAAVIDLARSIVARPGFRLVGVMTYEGQVAGVADDVPGRRARSFAVRRVKALSVGQLADRRAAIATALHELLGPGELEFWNAGGSGSLETSSADPTVTEVTAGSGLLVPGLFDHYRAFEPRPAAYFGVPVTRRPAVGLVTVHGGGLVASGAAGPDRLPIPWAPAGLALTDLEGAGEVQTPLRGKAAGRLRIGDLVWFRHAKSGELFEHTPTAYLVSGDGIVEEASTYRGHGLAL